MTGLIRKATLLSACALIAATAAVAGVPSAGNCDFPGKVGSGTIAVVKVGGQSAGIADSAMTVFQIVVRDVANAPILGSNVVIDLSGCSDVHVASNQQNTAKAVNCVGRSVSAYTDITGTVRFAILGNSAGVAAQVGAFGKMYADGVLLGTVTVPTFDLDGSSGVNGVDLGAFLTDLKPHVNYNRSDFDGNLLLNGADQAVFLTYLKPHLSLTTVTPTCP